MSYDKLIFRVHAIQRMFERDISEVEVRDVLENGEMIEEDSSHQPHPKRLMLGFCGTGKAIRPVHVLSTDDPDLQATIIVTVYEPDPKRWDTAFKQRR